MNGEEYARRFELLLDRFRKEPDGGRWRGIELQRASSGRLSGSYVSALRKGKIDKPSLEQLSLVAEVLGFPVELWWTDPERWDEVLEEGRSDSGRWHAGSCFKGEDWAILKSYRDLNEEHRGVVLALAERLVHLQNGEKPGFEPRSRAHAPGARSN